MEFEDYLVASGVRVEPEEIRANIIQPDYQDIINKFKASLKNNARFWFIMHIEKRVPNLQSADGWMEGSKEKVPYLFQSCRQYKGTMNKSMERNGMET